MHVLAAAKPVVPSPLDCSALHACLEQLSFSMYKSSSEARPAPHVSFHCSNRVRFASWQQQSKAKASIISIVCIVSDPIPSHLVSRASAVIAPVPWWPHKF